VADLQETAWACEDEGGLMPDNLGRLRSALGFDRLGKHVLSSIARELEAVGLGYFPLDILDPRCNTEPRKDQQVWVYTRDGGERARVLDAVLRPESYNVRSVLGGLVSGDCSSLTAEEKLRKVQDRQWLKHGARRSSDKGPSCGVPDPCQIVRGTTGNTGERVDS